MKNPILRDFYISVFVPPPKTIIKTVRYILYLEPVVSKAFSLTVDKQNFKTIPIRFVNN
jgi:hypothetical protein